MRARFFIRLIKIISLPPCFEPKAKAQDLALAMEADNSLSVLRLNPLRDITSFDLSHVAKIIIKGSFRPDQLNIV